VVETPVVEEPVVETPVVEEPVVETPVVEEPVVKPPIVDEPSVETPVVDETVVETPIVEQPIVETPIVEQPIVETPIVETPIVEQPIVETPIVETPVVDEPVVETPVVEQPVVETPVVEIEDHILDKPVLEKPTNGISLNLPKKLPELITNITNNTHHKELLVLFGKETINILIAILEIEPELFTDIETTLIEIIKDNTIDSRDFPELIKLIKSIFTFIYKVKRVKMDTKKRIEICSDVLKFSIHVLLVENKIRLDDRKKVEIDHIVDSCVSLLFYPKTLKPPGCFKRIFSKK
jgi:hypothetical protein